MTSKSVSLVILTYNGLEHVRALIPSLKRQTVQPEIIAIDSQSTDGTREYLESEGILPHVIPSSSFDHGGTRNLGLQLASHELVAYVTHDVIFDNDDALELLVEPLQRDSAIAMSFGRQLPKEGASILSEFARLNNYPEGYLVKSLSDTKRFGIKTPWISNSFSAYKKSVLNRFGGFPSQLIMCEDVFVGGKAILAGYKIAYVGDARVYHSHNYSVKEEFQRYFDIGYFYNSERWILDSFSKAETEGVKYVINEISFLMKHNKWYLLPEFAIRTVAKFLGYKLGKYAEKIPFGLTKNFSMHSYYWKKMNVR